jgi:hypothetical protein
MAGKLTPKIILEGTRLTHKTDLAFALNEHPRIVGPRRYRYHSPLISAIMAGRPSGVLRRVGLSRVEPFEPTQYRAGTRSLDPRGGASPHHDPSLDASPELADHGRVQGARECWEGKPSHGHRRRSRAAGRPA